MKNKIYRAVLSASVSLLCCAPAMAQTASTVADPAPPTAATASAVAESTQPAADVAGDIVVTAQRRVQRLQDVPISVSVTSGEQLTRQNLNTMDAVTARLPAVKVAANTNSDTIAIRGISSGQNAGFEQAVGIFVDGVYRGRSRSTRSALFDIERVEVLKGPQTTYFGNNTVAGAINITTRKPSDTFGVSARTYYTPSTHEYTLGLAVEGPLSDTFSYRVVGEASGMNGYLYNQYEKSDGPHMRDLQGRIALRWKPSDTFQSDFRFDRVHNRDVNTDVSELTNCPPQPVYGAATGTCALYLQLQGPGADTKADYVNNTLGLFFRYDMVEAAWTNRFNIGENTLTLSSSYFDHTAHVTTNSSPLALPTPFPGIIARGPFQNIDRDENYSQEVRFESPTGRFFQYVVGAYYLHDKLRSDAYSGFYTAPFGSIYAPAFYTALDPIALNRNLSQKTDTKSVFAAVTVTPLRGLHLNASARYSSVRKEAHRFALVGKAGQIPGPDNFIVGPDAAQALIRPRLAIDGTDFITPVRNYSKLMPTASIQYDVTPRTTVYASFAKGFKAGGFAESNVSNTFDSEDSTAYEVGVKGSIPGAGVFYTLDAFTSTFSNLQVAYTFVSPQGVSSSVVANAASARSRGVEGSVNWRASDAFSFRADVAYVDAIYTNYANAPCSELNLVQTPTKCLQNQSGMTRPFAPKLSGSVGAEYNLSLSADDRIRFEPLVYFTSKFNVAESLDALLEQKGFAKVDFRVGYGPKSGKWEIALVGKNLTDQKSFFSARALGTSRGSTYVRLDPPRTVSISAMARF